MLDKSQIRNNKPRMKIAYFIGALNRGGLESLTLDICRMHGETPYDFVCIYRHEGNMSEDFKKSGANLIHVPKKRGYLRYLWTLRREFIREKVTIVHSQTPSNTLLLSLVLHGTGIKVVTTFHGHFDSTPWIIRKIVYSTSDSIICVSKHLKEYTEKEWHLPKRNKLQIVYNGIDFSKIDLAKPSLEFAGTPHRIRLAMVGNFVLGRSQHIIVKSIHILHQQGVRDFDFYFIGKRAEQEAWRYDDCVHYCEEYNLNNVHFLGSRGDVPELLKMMDGFVYSTEHDTFGIAVIEAIAAGLPIVVNDWPVMTEVCNLGLPETNSAIRFFKTDDVEDCANKMRDLIISIDSKRHQLRQDCRLASITVKQKYSIQSHIENLNKIYQKTCL